MKKSLLILSAIIIIFCNASFGQSISNVAVVQTDKTLAITYDLTGKEGLANFAITLFVSTDGGINWEKIATGVTGAIGENIKPGKGKSISWNVLASRDKLQGDNIVFKVIANYKEGPVITNKTTDNSNKVITNTNKSTDGKTITDIDGNVYHTVTIGSQVWLVENLNTTRYRDGTPIPNITDPKEWNNFTTGAYCEYDNNPENGKIYGKLYNWYAVNNSSNIAPEGWHVASDEEWTTLTTYLGGEEFAFNKLKENGTTHWKSPKSDATNETNFTALPSGGRFLGGSFDGMYYGCVFWSSSEFNLKGAWLQDMRYKKSRRYYPKKLGFSVRCTKDI